MSIKITKIKDVITPNRGTPESAGIDFYVPKFNKEFLMDFYEKNPKIQVSKNEIILYPNERVLIPAGIKYNIPRGTALVAMNKSGVATKKGLIVGACVGDSDYMGELHISVINTSDSLVSILEDMKLIQFLLLPVLIEDIVEYETVEKLYENKESLRGDGGFGSTGV